MQLRGKIPMKLLRQSERFLKKLGRAHHFEEDGKVPAQLLQKVLWVTDCVSLMISNPVSTRGKCRCGLVMFEFSHLGRGQHHAKWRGNQAEGAHLLEIDLTIQLLHTLDWTCEQVIPEHPEVSISSLLKTDGMSPPELIQIKQLEQLLNDCLRMNPEARMCAGQALKHEFLRHKKP